MINADTLKGIAQTMLAWAIRPFVNHALTKNTTDVALAVGAMELACLAPKPSVIAIVSRDADFVPLVVRLRECGIRVICVSERTKMASAAAHACDAIVYVGKEVANVRTKPAAAVPAAVKKSADRKVAVKVVKPVPEMPPKAKKEPVKKMAPAAKTIRITEVTLEQILNPAPALKSAQMQPLGDIVKDLHHAKLIGKHAISTRLFKKFPDRFELSPDHQSNQVRNVAI